MQQEIVHLQKEEIKRMKTKHRFFKDKMAVLGCIILCIFIIISILTPSLTTNDPLKVDLMERLNPPSSTYPMGTDHLGRCVFTRVLYGGRTSMTVAVAVLGIVLTIGVLVGVLAGYIGGFVDTFISHIIDILLAFPGLILALAIAGILGPSLINTMIAVAAVQWVGYARIVRGMVLSIKEKDYVKTAKTCGTSHFFIILRHILPNMISPIIVLATLDVGAIILRIAALSFLGLGAQPPTPEWGAMINDGRAYMQTAPWVMFFPGGAILLVVMAFNLLGDGLRDIYDPKNT
ncbi:nickel transporter permease [Natronincola ferrireducens]|uniref:Peptide/nickel transport system permease protein n=1 Tax=Natronincola ferrireducens TaxID=393762 RepID=A0A1G9GJY8_9FIRM|nr:nickel transporter permease [Natronincola ferrireducens]SDL00987.1 peptide/nickel transport system permease protein [Natronincola ferrireducens]